MIIPKVKLSITLPGRVMYSEQEAEKNNAYKSESFSLFQKKTKKYRKFNYQVRECIPAIQSINISKKSYDAMTSTTPLPGFTPQAWKRMTKTQRLEEHLKETCKFFNGLDFSYSVFDD